MRGAPILINGPTLQVLGMGPHWVHHEDVNPKIYTAKASRPIQRKFLVAKYEPVEA